jgi:SAM-dependent methyltransferase
MQTTAPEISAVLTGAAMRAVDKRELILSMARGKDVLDTGCIQHSWRMSVDNPAWLHAAIRDVAQTCVGVDFLADDAAKLNELGFDVRVGNVLRDDPPGQFDLVVAGDIIEHLEDPGVFLEYIAKALRPGGRAVITTPSAFYIAQWWTLLARGRPAISPEHAVLFDPFTFSKLVDRGPLELEELRWLTPSWWAFWDSGRLRANLIGRPLHLLMRPLLRLRPYLNSDFAAVLRLREGGGERDVAGSARDVMDYLHQG